MTIRSVSVLGVCLVLAGALGATDPAVAAIAEAAETMTFMGYDLGRIAEE